MALGEIRKYYTLISQLLGACYCIYFILNVQNYKISWNLFAWAFPGLTSNINVLLSNIGTFILIIPLTIITMSLLHPESYRLRLISTFFGTASTIFLIINGFLKNTLNQAYNMGIFLITKILSLEEKKEIFIKEFTTNLEQYRSNPRLFSILTEQLQENHFTTYNNKLLLLEDPITIKLYAQKILEDNVEMFERLLANEESIKNAIYMKYILYTGAGIALTLIAFAIIRSFIDTNELIEGAKLARETAFLASQTNKNLLDTQNTVAEGFRITKELCFELVQLALKLQSEETENAFQLVYNKIFAIEKGLLKITETLIDDSNSNI